MTTASTSHVYQSNEQRRYLLRSFWIHSATDFRPARRSVQ